MKKIFYFLAIAAAISFAACADKTTEVIDEENPEQGQLQVINIDAEPLTLFNDKDTKPEEASVAGTRIVYVDSEPGSPNHPGLDARWEFDGTTVQDKIEFFISGTSTSMFGGYGSDAAVGRLRKAQKYPNDPDKKNVCELITVIDGVRLNKPVFYCSVTGSGMAAKYPAETILNYNGPYQYFGITSSNAEYFQLRNSTYPLIRTQFVTTGKIMNLAFNYADLKKSIIQVVSGDVEQGNYIFMRYRPIVMLINLELKNGTNAPINVSKIELASATQWAYDMSHSDTRYDPKLKTMSGNEVSAYKIFENTSAPYSVAANGVLNSYQVAIPAVASISDFKMRITIDGTVQTIDLSGPKTLAAEKRIKIKRTWNGTGFVK